MTVKVLIPYNFTANDEKSLDFVASKYSGGDVHLTLFHAYQPVPHIDVKNNPIMDKAERAGSYLRQLLGEQEKELERVRQRLITMGFRGDNLECVFTALHDDLAADIIHLAQTRDVDEVVLNRNPGNIVNYFSRSISKRVTNILTEIRVHVIN